MSSRDEILASINRNLPQAVELPDHSGDWIEYDDPVQQFRSVLEGIGGTLEVVSTVESIPEKLGDLIGPEKIVVSCISGVLEDSYDLSAVNDPHALEDVHLAILPGEVAVAENAAVWVTDEHVPLRVLFFLSQHLALVVPQSEVVSNMHQAYERIDASQRAFGTFISGPSKTADIEQSLVKGAHGARTMTIFLVKDLSR